MAATQVLGSLAAVGNSYFGCRQKKLRDYFCIMLPGGVRISAVWGVVDPERMPPGVVGHGLMSLIILQGDCLSLTTFL